MEQILYCYGTDFVRWNRFRTAIEQIMCYGTNSTMEQTSHHGTDISIHIDKCINNSNHDNFNIIHIDYNGNNSENKRRKLYTHFNDKC